MQKTANDVSIINYTGNPEGFVAANPSSESHDPVSGAIYRKATGTGNTGWVQTSSPTVLTTVYNLANTGATWTKNPSTQSMEVFIWGGGAGGGSGRKGTTGASGGGAGGNAGGCAYFIGDESTFPDSAIITIGAGGAGGASQTTDATNGNPGVVGGLSSFGAIGVYQNGASAGGTTGNADPGAGSPLSSRYGLLNPGISDSSNTPVLNVGSRGTVAISTTLIYDSVSISGTGGGGGGGANSVTQVPGKKAGDFRGGTVSLLAGGTAGLESTGINGGNGNSPIGLFPTATPTGYVAGGTGGGGGGGYSVGAGGATAGGTGGAGAVPGGGGGGGGGGLSGVANSGAGGAGAAGRIVVVEYL